MKQLISNDKFKQCHISTLPDYNEKEKKTYFRTCILRPFFNNDNTLICGFDDNDFWNSVISSINELPMDIINYDDSKNDPTLDNTKKWYTLRVGEKYNDGTIVNIPDENKQALFKHQYKDMTVPLTSLTVRYAEDIDSFCKNLT